MRPGNVMLLLPQQKILIGGACHHGRGRPTDLPDSNHAALNAIASQGDEAAGRHRSFSRHGASAPWAAERRQNVRFYVMMRSPKVDADRIRDADRRPQTISSRRTDQPQAYGADTSLITTHRQSSVCQPP